MQHTGKGVSIGALLAALTATAVLAIVLSAVLAEINISQLARSNASVLATNRMARTQGDVDMMHDAIRADVYKALLAASSAQTADAEAARQDFAEHAKLLRDDFAANLKQLPGDARSMAEAAQPVLERYVSTAGNIVSQPTADASSQLLGFNKDFEALEAQLAQLTDAIEAHASQESAAAEAAVSRSMLSSLLGGGLAVAILLAVGLWVYRDSVPALRQLARQASAIAASGDLRQAPPSQGCREVRSVAEAIAQMLERQRAVVTQTHSAVDSIGRNMSVLSNLSEHVRQHADAQDGMVQNAMAGFEEAAESIALVAGNAQRAVSAAQSAGTLSQSGANEVQRAAADLEGMSHAVQDVSGIIGSLVREANEISSVVSAIREIADQTNLLALNAAIEAARAGEQGRGFAVVADEVRKLAERTSGSTDQVFALIERIARASEAAVKSVDASVSTVTAGIARATDSARAVAEIPAAANEVIHGMREISDALNAQRNTNHGIAGIIDQVSQATRAASENAHTLDRLVRETGATMTALTDSVRQFKV